MISSPNRGASVLLCAAGDTHGRLAELYDGVLDLEEDAGRRVDLVCHVGDFGIWSHASELDKATRKRNQVGDFPEWYRMRKAVPRPTLFVPGNHEDFDLLQRYRTGDQLLPGLMLLGWGDMIDLNVHGQVVRIGGVGGCYSSRDYGKRDLTGRCRRHYTRAELDQLREQTGPGLDALLLHDAPDGAMADPRDVRAKPRRKFSFSEGLRELIAEVQPRICLTGHYHIRTDRRIEGVRTVGLNMVPGAGSLILIEFPADGSEPRILGENEQRSFRPPPPEALPIRVEEVEVVLRSWAQDIMGSRTGLSREERKQVYLQLAAYPRNGVLMSALKGKDLRRAIEHYLPSSFDRAAVLQLWENRGLPTVTMPPHSGTRAMSDRGSP